MQKHKKNEKNMAYCTSKRSKFNWKFNSNVLMSIQGVPVSESAGTFPNSLAGKFPNSLFIESKMLVAVTRTRTCHFS